MKAFKILLVSVILSSCVNDSNSDYFVNGNATQKIQMTDIKEVEIICYCSGKVETRRFDSSTLILDVTANSSSVGYHGEQTEPDKVSSNLLSFSVERGNGKLILRSRESTYIHHASVIESLKVNIPYNVRLSIRLIEGTALEGRRVD